MTRTHFSEMGNGKVLENGQTKVVVSSSFPGGIAQLVERRVRNAKARGSNPLTSTMLRPVGLRMAQP